MLYGALMRGYTGVEVDLQFVRGKLLLGHDREVTRPDLTFETSYLRWLAERKSRCGEIMPGGGRFWLFIDLKTKGMPGYRALRSALAQRDSLFTTIRGGVERPGPVTVVLVGWGPPLDTLIAETTRYVSVNRRLEDVTPADLAAPAHLVRMISLDAKRLKGWSGKGEAPDSWASAFRRLRAASGGTEGRIARLLHSRVNPGIYRYALSSGATLIGTEFLRESSACLTSIGAYRNSASP
ncbi:MAG TPA: hypothetical protein VFU59_08890 [Candidatus Eisenbacteria bacterium]|nr:hypothetical protein [Candidatus Eisenbacteria bacterium]